MTEAEIGRGRGIKRRAETTPVEFTEQPLEGFAASLFEQIQNLDKMVEVLRRRTRPAIEAYRQQEHLSEVVKHIAFWTGAENDLLETPISEGKLESFHAVSAALRYYGKQGYSYRIDPGRKLQLQTTGLSKAIAQDPEILVNNSQVPESALRDKIAALQSTDTESFQRLVRVLMLIKDSNDQLMLMQWLNEASPEDIKRRLTAFSRVEAQVMTAEVFTRPFQDLIERFNEDLSDLTDLDSEEQPFLLPNLRDRLLERLLTESFPEAPVNRAKTSVQKTEQLRKHPEAVLFVKVLEKLTLLRLGTLIDHQRNDPARIRETRYDLDQLSEHLNRPMNEVDLTQLQELKNTDLIQLIGIKTLSLWASYWEEDAGYQQFLEYYGLRGVGCLPMRANFKEGTSSLLCPETKTLPLSYSPNNDLRLCFNLPSNLKIPFIHIPKVEGRFRRYSSRPFLEAGADFRLLGESIGEVGGKVTKMEFS